MHDFDNTPMKMLLEIEVTPSKNYLEFTERYAQAGLLADYGLAQMTAPVRQFSQEILNHISEFGLSSLYNPTVSMEDITSSSMSFDQVEAVVCRFVQKLLPATRLVVVDPYFYKSNKAGDTDAFLARLLGPQAKSLQHVYVVSNGRGDMHNRIHTALCTVAPQVTVMDVKTDEFHDRFWINPDTGAGIVMGTSLNGLGARVALVDILRGSDVQEVLTEVRRHIPNV